MKTVFGKLPFSVLTLSLFFLVLSFSVTAQNLDTVTISGKITDSNKSPVVGASVTATQIEKNIERTVVSDENGVYKIVNLEPGTYVVKATAANFGTTEQKDLATVSGQNVQLDLVLAPAGVTAEQTIDINGDDAPAVDTTRTVVGGTITEREIEELPNNSRNALDLVLTLGGTSEEALSTRDLAEDRNANPRSTPTEQGNFSLSGGASYSNNITIDGLDNNDDRSARDRFQPSLEAVAEVQVIRNQFSAEYGRASGGRVNIRTRGGTNKFRGRAFIFFRDDNLNANTYYNNSRGIARLPLTEYNSGFTFGGPIPFFKSGGKNRTFFFVAYEYDKLKDTTLIDTYIPVAANSRFTLPSPTGTAQFCDSSTAAACTAVPPTAGFVSPYTLTFATPNVGHVLSARVDHQLFKGNNLTFGLQYGRKNNRRTTGAATTRIEDTLQAKNVNTDAFNFTDSQVFNANAVNDFRFQWSKYSPSYQTDNPLDPVVLIGYRNPVTNSVQTLIAGNSSSSTLQNFADSRQETRFQILDSVTYILGKNTLKFGGDIQDVNSKATSLGDATGTFNFSSVLNYQNNTLSRFRQNFGTATDVKNRYYGFFGNDEMRIGSNITLSMGVRYEKETAVSDNNNFGPRLGIAWDPFKKGRTVVRFGAGIFYNRVLLRTVGDFIQNSSGNLFQFDSNNIGTSGSDSRRLAVLTKIAQQFPTGYASVTDLKNALTSLGLSQSLGFSASTGNSSNPLRTIDPNLKIPESYQFNIGFEQELGNKFVFEANYTWNKTANLWREYNPNVPVVPPGYADFTAYLLANPFTFTNTNGTIRTYNFVLGATNDATGVATAAGGTCSTTAAVTCIVNLNSINGTTTFPSTSTIDSTNSVGTPLGIALAAVARFRPNQALGETARVASIGNSFYQGLVLELRSRYRKLGYGFGSSFRGVYTLSSQKDDGLNNTSNAEINGNFDREFTRGLQDRRHRFTFSGTFETPSWIGKLRYSPIFRYGSSAPFSLGYGVDRNLDDNSTDRPNFSGNIRDIVYRNPGSAFPTALAAQFSLPPIGARSGNLPRNAGRGPSLYVFDLNVSREFKFNERFRLRPTIEFGNILNLAIFSYGSEFIDFTALGATPTATQLANYQNFLIPTRTYRARDIKLGMRFDF